MNGSESLIKTLVNNGVEVCFTNPGTSEMHFVAALDEVEGMRCILGLFEGVVSGAADGYARMAGKPAATLLHLGPGLSNALANIHNAKKGHVPMINIVGDHASYHIQYDAPLTSDIEGIAGTVSHWVHRSLTTESIASDGTKAVIEAGDGRIATLILPADISWSNNFSGEQPAAVMPARTKVTTEKLQHASEMLRGQGSSMIMIGGREITADMSISLSKISAFTGARVCLETFPTRVARGAGRGQLEKLPYLAEMAVDHLKDIDNLILLGAKSPVAFFAYPNLPGVLPSQSTKQLQLALAHDDIAACLTDLLHAVGADETAPMLHSRNTSLPPTGALQVNKIAQTLNNLMPDNAVVVDDACTASMACYPGTQSAAPHDWLALTGGAIGFGLPCAVGAAVACPDRKVICLEGDGSAMYTIQALWTMARENLDITVVVFNNQKYSILELEFARTGARGGIPGPKAASMLDIGSPTMNFTDMATSMGVAATRASSAEEFTEQFTKAMRLTGPRLIEAMVPPLNFQ
ncbi:UNVERIFIED_CONTAM: hypothetical protein GTU68_009640 [Idotea baltica]|nr:hypothetical protein [Idotea baltica]